jgi:2-keto-4-pentenoate hydratase
VGAKIGLTSAAVRTQIGVEEPDFGILFDDMRVEDGGLVDPRALMQPRLEAEIAFRMGTGLPDPGLSRDDVIGATASVSAAIEIVASRIEGWRCSIADTVADNASAGLFVLGSEAHRLDPELLPSLTMSLSCDGKTVSEGVGAASMGDPVEAVLWLARTFAHWGRPLQAGDIVLSGALGPLVDAVPGCEYRAKIDNLGSASLRFAS